MIFRKNRSAGFPRRNAAITAALLGVVVTSACGPDNCDAPGTCADDPSLEGEGAGNTGTSTGTTSYGNTAANRTWWRSMSQNERNNRILDRASRDLDRFVGLNCKQWVRKVVASASNGVVEIPSTYPTETGWQWYQGSGVAGMSANIRNAKPGWIVQMNIPDADGSITPHTAIVAGVSSNGITWIDSNYMGPNYVDTHYQSFANFERATYIGGRYRYSVYTITGTY